MSCEVLPSRPRLGATSVSPRSAGATGRPTPSPNPSGAPDRASRRLRVLVIEDNPDTADTLRMLLDLAGHEVRVCYRGDEGFEAALEDRPDVVVSDIGLPGMDGYEIARQLRRHDEMAGTRLIAVTGYGQEDNRRRAVESGFEAWFVKPVDPERLLDALADGG